MWGQHLAGPQIAKPLYTRKLYLGNVLKFQGMSILKHLSVDGFVRMYYKMTFTTCNELQLCPRHTIFNMYSHIIINIQTRCISTNRRVNLSHVLHLNSISYM